MFSHFIKYVYFVLLVVALPSQALGCISKSEAHNNTHHYIGALAHQPVFTISHSISFHLSQSLSNEKTSSHPAVSQPITKSSPLASQSLHSHTSIALVSNSLWGGMTRFTKYNEPTFVDTPPYDISAISSFKLYPLPTANISTWVSRRAFSHYRISGWKDSNVMYVALNSQY